MKNAIRAAGLFASLAMLTAVPARAAVTVNIRESRGNVFVSTKGSIDTRGLQRRGTFGLDANQVRGRFGYLLTGQIIYRDQPDPFLTNSMLVPGLVGFTGPNAFGSSTMLHTATAQRGAIFGINALMFATAPYVFLRDGYQSGEDLAGWARFDNATIASLGLTVGQYVYTSPFDRITINIGSVPEPATWAMLIAGFAAVGGALRRRGGSTHAPRARGA